MRGVISKLIVERGFGFIQPLAGAEVFFHRTGLQATTRPFEELQVGDHVEFTEIESAKGPRAIEVRVL